jgi:ATP-binding cassette subfamily B protein
MHMMRVRQMPETKAKRGTFRRVARAFYPYWGRSLLVLVAILAGAALGLVNPVVMGLIIDQAIRNKDLQELTVLVAIMFITPVVSGLISVGQTYLNTTVGQRVMRDFRVRLYAHLQAMSLRFFTATRTGEILSRLTNDVNGVQAVVTDTFSSVLSNIVVVMSTLVVMLRLNWQLTLVSLCMVPFFLYPTYKMGKIRRGVSRETQATLANMSSILEETLSVSGALLVKSFGRQRAETNRFASANEELMALQIRQSMIGRWFFMIIQTFFSIAPALIYYFGGRQIISGTLTIGALVAFTTLQSRLFMPLGGLLNVNVDLQGALALFDRIFEYLDMPLEITDRPGAQDLREAKGDIRYRHVSFEYVEGQPTLSDVDFEALPGQLVALVGPSGAGKTTITYMLPRLYDVSAGSVEIDGIDVRDLTLESLGRNIGLVTQETYLLHASIRDNVTYGVPGATDDEIVSAATAAYIHDRIMELPDGYDTIVGERGYKLSGGEKQRLAIARVILKNPRILILDEATSALDTHSERLIQRALDPLMAGRTTLAVAHRLSTILAADQILVVAAGRIDERGTHRELLAKGGIYASLYHEQFGDGKVQVRCADGVIGSDGLVIPLPNSEEPEEVPA